MTSKHASFCMEEGTHGLLNWRVSCFVSQNEWPKPHLWSTPNAFSVMVMPECLRQQRARLEWWGAVLGWNQCETRSAIEFSMNNSLGLVWFITMFDIQNMLKFNESSLPAPWCYLLLADLMKMCSSTKHACRIGQTSQPQIVTEKTTPKWLEWLNDWLECKTIDRMCFHTCFSRSSDQLDLKPADLASSECLQIVWSSNSESTFQ